MTDKEQHIIECYERLIDELMYIIEHQLDTIKHPYIFMTDENSNIMKMIDKRTGDVIKKIDKRTGDYINVGRRI